jgi:hypothetical protein
MEMEAREPLSKRLGRFIALLGAVGMIAGVVVVTQRLSQDSLALLVGLSCGVAAMLPTIGLALLVWRREESRQQVSHQQPVATPPVVVITPQALSGYGMPPALSAGASQPVTWQWQPNTNERVFTIVGGEE